MSFTKVLGSISASAQVSALVGGVNAIGVGTSNGPPDLHIVTLMVAGTNAGGSFQALLGTNASVTASSPWTTIADSTVDNATTKSKNLWVPTGSFITFIHDGASAGTYNDLYMADSQQGKSN